MKNITLYIFLSLLFLNFLPCSLIISGGPSNAYAQQDWKQEYSDICAKTQNAMELSTAELKEYVDRCDKLMDRIDKPDGLQSATEKKVYSKRLKMCRDLYEFALEHKEIKD